MGGQTPDVIMRSLDARIEGHVATEDVIKSAFIMSGYGEKRTEHWWNFYRKNGYIRPVSKNGVLLKDEHGSQLYSSLFWVDPAAIVWNR